MPATIKDEQRAAYKTANDLESGRPWRCEPHKKTDPPTTAGCGALLGYMQQRLITIVTDECHGTTTTRQINVLQRISPRGERGDLIIGDADIRCAICGEVWRWDFRRAWDK